MAGSAVVRVASTTLRGIPRPYQGDRVLATRLSLAAVDAIHGRAWGKMVATGAEAVGQLKTVPQHRYDAATYLFG